MTYTEAAIKAVEVRPGDPDEAGSPEAIEAIPMSLTERCPRSNRASEMWRP
jgi:hypothetical protein